MSSRHLLPCYVRISDQASQLINFDRKLNKFNKYFKLSIGFIELVGSATQHGRNDKNYRENVTKRNVRQMFVFFSLRYHNYQ